MTQWCAEEALFCGTRGENKAFGFCGQLVLGGERGSGVFTAAFI